MYKLSPGIENNRVRKGLAKADESVLKPAMHGGVWGALEQTKPSVQRP